MADDKDEVLSTHMFEQKYGQLKKQPHDKDRLRLAKNLAENFTFSSEQAADIILAFHFQESMMDAARLFFPRVYDQENFSSALLPRLNYDEDRIAISEEFGVELCGMKEKPAPKKEETDAKMSGHAWLS